MIVRRLNAVICDRFGIFECVFDYHLIRSQHRTHFNGCRKTSTEERKHSIGVPLPSSFVRIQIEQRAAVAATSPTTDDKIQNTKNEKINKNKTKPKRSFFLEIVKFDSKFIRMWYAIGERYR